MDARWRGLPGLASRRARATRALTRVSCPTWQCPSGPPEMEEAMTRPFVWFLTGLIMLGVASTASAAAQDRSEEHTSELQSHLNLVCRLLLEKKKKAHDHRYHHTFRTH